MRNFLRAHLCIILIFGITANANAYTKQAGKPVDKSSLSVSEKKFLLKLARQNIESYLNKNKPADVNQSLVPGKCKKAMGVFVTLKKKGKLRGCIGYILPIKPLYLAVMENSYNAAFSDPRFSELTRDELKDISIEISVLTEPVAIKTTDEIVVGRDGLIIEQYERKGILLPQVPVEWGWNRDEFLVQICRKAGLPDDAWKNGAKIYTFQAIVFGENR